MQQGPPTPDWTRTLHHGLRDTLGLPAYWRHSARARRSMPPHRRIPYGPHPRQYYLLLEPPGSLPTDVLPWALYLHGGGWTFGTPEAFRPAARPWLRQGFRVVLPSYRRPPTVRLPEIVADCRTAVTHLANFARTTDRPLSAPQIGGISAGGHLAALLALHPQWWTAAGWPAPPTHALLCAAPLDFSLLRPRRIFAHRRAQDPILQLAHPPQQQLRWLLLHGTRDGLADYRHSLHFHRALEESGAAAELHTIPGGGHLASGRWTYDDSDPYAATVADFIRSAAPAPPGPA
ncbi:hypothetical protein LEM8419_02373 [Neolewinella maritima]|uniref:Alpha/beta hydrolase fold-3 domain-containing protein n=1 Tax=Neolewinella maritima TaxID=1383882 RepID=A0ABN8F8B7_9BACT|nr:alpha/beta hydrolase [Neolewinella maritima]CAH1001470.1 hypothetical protein LEM8419_02373 [Neolewinella maritima]